MFRTFDLMAFLGNGPKIWGERELNTASYPESMAGAWIRGCRRNRLQVDRNHEQPEQPRNNTIFRVSRLFFFTRGTHRRKKS